MKQLATIQRGAQSIFYKGKFLAVKHSPEILMVSGISSIAMGTVLACKATLRIDDILDEFEDKKEVIKEYAANPLEGVPYLPKEYKQDMTVLHVQTGVSLIKLYSPALILSATGIACILTSHNILKKRNVALAAAYSVLDKGFKEYRSRVVNELGEEKDRQFRHGLRQEEITREEIDERGKKKKIAETVNYLGDHGPSMYARVFDRYIDEDQTKLNNNWDPNLGYNKMFLQHTQNWANDMLKVRGHVFLNEVYDMLGFERTSYGAVVGWVLPKDSSQPIGDGYIDFGIFEVGRNDYADDFVNDTLGEQKSDFINERTNRILLDFNVDGTIHTMI